MVVELLNKSLGGVYEVCKVLMDHHGEVAVCLCLRREGWISIGSCILSEELKSQCFF